MDTIIGGKIRAARKELRFTIKELCRKIERSPQQLQKYETGQNRVSATLLLEISKLFGKPLTWFFEGPNCEAVLENNSVQHPEFDSCLSLLRQLQISDAVPEIKAYLVKAVAANR